MSLGKITVLKKDGITEGSIVDIKKEIIIGSAHPANIRIKSPNIAIEHARIFVDENGKWNLVSLVNSNFPKINGKPISNGCLLSNGDNIVMGGRVFLFTCQEMRTPVVNGIQEEYGRLVQLKHNGEDGVVVKIHGDILIGSRPSANICIKSSLISKQHAKITIDSKKNCVLEHLSSMFPPKVNGISKKKCILRHGDSIIIGDRSFLYQQSSSRMYSSPVGLHKRSLQGSRATLSFMNSPSRGTGTSSALNLSAHIGVSSCKVEDINFPKHSASIRGYETDKVPTYQIADSDGPPVSPSTLTSSMLRAMRKDTASLLPDGRPSMDTMTAQWEFMRDQFLGNSDEALQWMMLAKNGGVDAYRHAHRKVQIAEDQYYKSLYDIDLLERKLIVVGQLQPILKSDCSNGTKHVAAKESLQKQLTGNMRGVCCKVLDNSLRELLSLEDEAEAANAASEILSIVYVDEIKKIKERLQAAQQASVESLAEMEKWGDREKQTTEYGYVRAAEDNEWLECHHEENMAALQEMRRLIPINITELSASELTRIVDENEGFYTHELVAEIKNNKLLHWIVMHPNDIAKANFLSGEHRQYFVNIECLDVVEMRAIRLCLPEKFDFDKDGQKEEWRERFISRLKQMVSQDCEEVVRGGWDPDCGKRAMVSMPPLRDEQKRRSVYFYKTHDELAKKVAQYTQRDSLLSQKEHLLVTLEEEEKECRREYETILEESRDPACKVQYGAGNLLLAKEYAKRDFIQAEEKRKRTAMEVQRLQLLIRENPITKEDLVAYIGRHALFLSEYNWDTTAVLVQIIGVFDSCPEIIRVERVAAKFVTAEEEAEHRKNEISAIKKEVSSSATTVEESAEVCDSGEITPRMKRSGSSILENTPSELVKTLNKVLTHSNSLSSRSLAGVAVGSSVNTLENASPTTAVNRPIRSKYLKQIIDDKKKSNDTTSSSATDANSGGRPSAPISFLDQIKNAKKKQHQDTCADENAAPPQNLLAAIKNFKRK